VVSNPVEAGKLSPRGVASGTGRIPCLPSQGPRSSKQWKGEEWRLHAM
jgi:hypothetical protein